jgi:hypothetical protein
MGTLKDLLAFLFDSLTTTLSPTTSASGPAVYLEQADEDATFPYVTFRLSNSYEVESREDYTLNVDIWDSAIKTTDPTYIETLVRQIDGNGDRKSPTGLNGLKYYSTGKPAARIYRQAKAMLPDPDEAIRRRHLRYRVIVYDTTSS